MDLACRERSDSEACCRLPSDPLSTTVGVDDPLASFEAKAKAAVAEASASGGVGLGDRTTIIDYGS